jgi:hypothetical protein
VGLLLGVAREVIKLCDSRRPLERATIEGDSPVDEITKPSWKQFPSTAGHVQSRGKPGGPSPKAKYCLRPIVYQYREGKVKRTPVRGVK